MFGVEPSNIRGRWLEKGPSCDAQRRCHGWKASVVGSPMEMSVIWRIKPYENGSLTNKMVVCGNLMGLKPLHNLGE